MSDASIFVQERDKYLLEMEKDARKRYIPIIPPEVGQFLSVLIRAYKPKRILEIGTAIGYSTIWMAQAAGEDTEIVTIERDEEMVEEASKNFAHFDLEDRINIKVGDAVEIVSFLRRQFDFVFIDAAKGQYIYLLDAILEILPTGGIIVADNVLYRGYVQKKGKIKHKRRTMVNNLKKYLEIVTEHPLLETSIIPLGDGIAFSVRRHEK